MANIRGCILPDDRQYHVENNEWLRDLGDGLYELGMTDIAQSMAGTVLHCRIKKVGKKVRMGRSLATVESGKWVGPVKAPFSCEVVEKNEAVEADAQLLNRSPYTEGWIIRIKILDPAELGLLTDGDEAMQGFEAYMDEHDFSGCIHCEGFDAP